MTRHSRWMAVAAVAAVAAAAGTAWGVRRRRAAAAPTPAAPAAIAATLRPPTQPERPAAAATPLRRGLVAVAGVIAAAVAIGVVATHIDRSPSADRPFRVAVATSQFPIWTPTTTSTSTWTPPPLWTPVTTPPSPVPVGGVLPPDGSVLMRGDSGEEMRLTIERIANPAPTIEPAYPNFAAMSPKLGHRLVLVIVGVENTGGVPFIADLEKFTWLVDRAGHTYARSTALTKVRQSYPGARLDPETRTIREVVFEVKGNVEITRFRLSRHPGVAKQTQDWRLT